MEADLNEPIHLDAASEQHIMRLIGDFHDDHGFFEFKNISLAFGPVILLPITNRKSPRPKGPIGANNVLTTYF